MYNNTFDWLLYWNRMIYISGPQPFSVRLLSRTHLMSFFQGILIDNFSLMRIFRTPREFSRTPWGYAYLRLGTTDQLCFIKKSEKWIVIITRQKVIDVTHDVEVKESDKNPHRGKTPDFWIIDSDFPSLVNFMNVLLCRIPQIYRLLLKYILTFFHSQGKQYRKSLRNKFDWINWNHK